jgi:hypothetical protein
MEAYYTHFDTVIGEVTGETVSDLLETDLSVIVELPPRGLLTVESDARIAWNTAREALNTHYESLAARRVTSNIQLLEERVAPPGMVTDFPSTRDSSRERDPRNPAILHVWDGFNVAVSRFRPSNLQAVRPGGRKFDVFNACLASNMMAREEKDEQRYLIDRK